MHEITLSVVYNSTEKHRRGKRQRTQWWRRVWLARMATAILVIITEWETNYCGRYGKQQRKEVRERNQKSINKYIIALVGFPSIWLCSKNAKEEITHTNSAHHRASTDTHIHIGRCTTNETNNK